jgi:hypothetical protein
MGCYGIVSPIKTVPDTVHDLTKILFAAFVRGIGRTMAAESRPSAVESGLTRPKDKIKQAAQVLCST